MTSTESRVFTCGTWTATWQIEPGTSEGLAFTLPAKYRDSQEQQVDH